MEAGKGLGVSEGTAGQTTQLQERPVSLHRRPDDREEPLQHGQPRGLLVRVLSVGPGARGQERLPETGDEPAGIPGFETTSPGQPRAWQEVPEAGQPTHPRLSSLRHSSTQQR